MGRLLNHPGFTGDRVGRVRTRTRRAGGEILGGMDTQMDTCRAWVRSEEEPGYRQVTENAIESALAGVVELVDTGDLKDRRGGRSTSSRSAALFFLRGLRGEACSPSSLDTQVDTSWAASDLKQ
jgi:hypothetical protein